MPSYGDPTQTYDAYGARPRYGTVATFPSYSTGLLYDDPLAFESTILSQYDLGAVYNDPTSQLALYDPLFIATFAEAGAGGDTFSVTVSFALGDVSKGIESFNIQEDVVGVGILLGEIGLGADVIAEVDNYLTLLEQGKGVESITITSPPLTVNITVNESAVSSQTVALTNYLTAHEGVYGYDINHPKLHYDFPSPYDLIKMGNDNVALTVKFAVSETGAGWDIPVYSTRFYYDGRWLYDFPDINLSVYAPVTDTGSGTEAVLLNVPVEQDEYGTGYDTVVVLYNIEADETGVGTDAAIIVVPVALTDTAKAFEANPIYDDPQFCYDFNWQYSLPHLSVKAFLDMAEHGYGLDTQAINVAFTLSDTGHGTDISSFFVPTGVLYDFGVGQDTLYVLGALATQMRLQNKSVTIYVVTWP